LWLQKFGEGCRLPESGATRVVELPFEMIDLLTQALIFTPQSIALALSLFCTLAPVSVVRSPIRVVCLRRLRHAAVMPEFAVRYKTR
jgi:hypothetical protein